jgi:hypothetical protein
MATTNAVARAAHDIGLAGWFGGALMGAAGVNGMARKEGQTAFSVRAANEAWRRWSPVWAASVVLHGIGAARLTTANTERMKHQRGVAAAAAMKAALTLGALGASGYARLLARGLPEDTTPSPEQSDRRAKLAKVQWAVPALLAGVVALNARMGEDQRPAAVAEGWKDR